jgi:RNA recognition motif-containing protein
VQPNKVYIGGLPEHTRQEDLQSCFGKIGNITNIELKYVFGYLSVLPELIVFKGWLWFCSELLQKAFVVKSSL